MTPLPHPADGWPALRDRVAALHVVHCRLAHERVRLADGVVERVSRGGAETAVVRVGLCAPDVRARRLACGHTTARHVLQDALDALLAAGALAEAAHARMSAELNAVANEIHLLDHQKGEAEKAYAVAVERGEATAPADLARRALEARHERHGDRLAALRAAVLGHIDAAASSHRTN